MRLSLVPKEQDSFRQFSDLAANLDEAARLLVRSGGSRVIKLTPVHGFAAETGAGLVIQAASSPGMPVSTTQVITAAIMGVGSTQRRSAVRWGVARSIGITWVLTLPGTALVAALTYWLLTGLF